MSKSDLARQAHKAAAYLQRASVEFDDFSGAFAGVSDLLAGRSFHMIRVEANGDQQFFGPSESRSLLESYYANHWHESDTWSRMAQAGTRNGHIVHDQALIPEDVRRRDRFFQEFCRDWDLGHYAAWTFELGGQTWGYTLIRSHDHDYTPEDLAGLQLIRSSANRAALLACHFRDARARGIAYGLEQSGRPTIILDHDGKVMFLTSVAERYLGSAFTIQRGVLSGLDGETEAHLRRLRASIRSRIKAPAAFPMSSPLRSGPVIAVPMLMYDDYFASLPGAQALLMLIDPDGSPRTNRDVLRSAYGLSSREADLAVLMGMGMTLAAASEKLGLKLSSARQLAKSVMSKTESGRQAELVALIQRLASGTNISDGEV